MVWQYLLLLLLTMIVGSYTYYRALQNDKEDLVADTRSLLTNGMDLVDIRLDELRSQVIHFQRNENVIDIWNMVRPFEEGSQLTVSRLIQFLAIRTATNDIVDNILICFDKPRMIVGANMSTSRTGLFFKRFQNDGGFTSDFREVFEDSSIHPWIAGISSRGEHPKNYLMYIVPMVAEGSSDFKGNVIFVIDQENVSGLFRMFAESNVPLLITDAGGGLPMSWTGTREQLSELVDLAGVNVGQNWTKTGYFPIYVASWRSKLEFSALIPMKMVYEKISYIRKIFIITTLAELCLGLLLILYFIYSNYRPLNRILKKIQRFGAEDLPGKGGAYEVIEGGISRIIQHNYMLQGELEKHNVLLTNSLIDRLLRGSSTDTVETDSILKSFDRRCSYYAIALLKLNPLSYERQDDDIQDIQALRLIVNRLLEDTKPPDTLIHNAERDLVAVLIGMRDKPSTKERRDIENYYLSVRANLDFQYGIKTSVGIGSECDNLLEISRSYSEAYSALAYITTKEADGSIWFKETGDFSDNLYYPLAIEERLISALETGNAEEASVIADSVFKKNFVEKTLSAKNIAILFDEMRGTIARTMVTAHFYADQVAIVESALSGVDSYTYAEDIFSEFNKVFAALCGLVNERKKTENEIAIGRITEYIKHNFNHRDFLPCPRG